MNHEWICNLDKYGDMSIKTIKMYKKDYAIEIVPFVITGVHVKQFQVKPSELNLE